MSLIHPTAIIDALVAMIDDPEIPVAGLLKHIRGPDFPTGGEMLNTKKELREIYETGQGPIRLRGQYRVEQLPRGRQQIVVTSIPYAVNKAQLVEQIGDVVLVYENPRPPERDHAPATRAAVPAATRAGATTASGAARARARQ